MRGTVRIVLTSECCGEELKESNFDIDEHVDVEKHPECTCADWQDCLTVEAGGGEITERQETTITTVAKRGENKGQAVSKPIPSRYQKRYFGVSLPITVSCACGKEIGTVTFDDEVQASSMDELT